MRKSRRIIDVVVVMVVAAVSAATTACASATGAAAGPGAQPGGALSNAEVEALYQARLDSLRARFSAADVQFINGMIHHHAQALEMAALVPTRTTTSLMLTLAGRVTNAQQDEIALMQQWLRDRRQPVPEVHVMDGRIMVHGAEHAMHGMPGMLTAEQMAELGAARGAEFDRLFLTYMIQHHRGAVTMVHDLFNTDGAGQGEEIFKLASDVQVDQTTEIARMELMLSAMTGNAPPR